MWIFSCYIQIVLFHLEIKMPIYYIFIAFLLCWLPSLLSIFNLLWIFPLCLCMVYSISSLTVFLFFKVDYIFYYFCVLVTQSCPTLYHPMNCSPPGSSVHGDSPGQNTGVGCHALLQGISPTQGSNQGLLHGRQILYHPRHQGRPLQENPVGWKVTFPNFLCGNIDSAAYKQILLGGIVQTSL